MGRGGVPGTEGGSATGRLGRRTVLSLGVVGTRAGRANHVQTPNEDLPRTGTPVSGFESFDDLLTGFLRERGIPGGAIAVTKDGRLVYARGYGWADRERRVPYHPHMLTRIASVSKPITAVAVMKLVEDGKLDLETKAFPLLGLEPFIEKGRTPDPRLNEITVRQLLLHAGGFDRGQSFDPMFLSKGIANKMGVPSPAGSHAVIRYMMGRKLDFAPGTKYAYSNFGYCVLGRVIEKASGQPYERYVREQVLAPAGVTQMRCGKSRWSDRLPNEVVYHDGQGTRFPSVFAEDRFAEVPAPYGGWCIEAMDAHGGWLGSVVDLVRFAAALDAPPGRGLLSGRSRRAMYERPAAPLGQEPDGRPSPAYYGFGWNVRPIRNTGRANYWHTGRLDGSSTLLVRRAGGLSWAVNFNSEAKGKESLSGAIDPLMHRAADAVRRWPTTNRFREFDT